MHAATEPTSGTAALDDLIGQVHIGDNLVVVGDAATPLDLLVARYLAAALGHQPVVAVTVARSWTGEVPDGLTVLDWSAVTTGRPSSMPDALLPDATLADALASVRAADDAVGMGAVFAFDRLSAVQAAWSDDAALELFLSTCPRLYRRRSLALWPIERDAHTPSFLRRLTEVTQVVVEMVATDPDGPTTHLRCTVRKADGRAAEVVGRTREVQVVDGDLVATGAASSTRQRLGTLIRDQRLASGMAQAELARRVGISPSALSQVERGVRGTSGDTLMRLWEVLGVAFGPESDGPEGYLVSRRSGRERRSLQPGMTGTLLLDTPRTGQLWQLVVEPDARGDVAPFAVKSPESITVVRGVLDLTLGGRTEILHEGDALLTTGTPVTAWANPSTRRAELQWHLHPAG
ncbi:MAG: helix-turn-helix domain-containing protein [Nitriliruptoraceae bacterium]